MARKLLATFTGGATAPVVRAYFDPEWEEYRVRVPGNPAADYFTSSYVDAIGTARLMAGEGWIDSISSFEPPPGLE